MTMQIKNLIIKEQGFKNYIEMIWKSVIKLPFRKSQLINNYAVACCFVAEITFLRPIKSLPLYPVGKIKETFIRLCIKPFSTVIYRD